MEKHSRILWFQGYLHAITMLPLWWISPWNALIAAWHDIDSQFPIGNGKRSRQWKQLPPHAWFSLAVTTGWDIQPLHPIHHSTEYHRSAGSAWRQGGLLLNHTDTLSQPKGGQSLSQPTNPKTMPRYINHPQCAVCMSNSNKGSL